MHARRARARLYIDAAWIHTCVAAARALHAASLWSVLGYDTCIVMAAAATERAHSTASGTHAFRALVAARVPGGVLAAD